jgi:hypothetical protein
MINNSMMPSIDYNRLRTLGDIQIAKEKLRYSLQHNEDLLYNSIDSLQNNLILSLKHAAWRWGLKVAAGLLIDKLKKRASKKG